MYDHGARNRNPVSTLWYGIDPLFEKFPNISPYTYCHQNPIIFVDPDGRTDYYNLKGKQVFTDEESGGSKLVLTTSSDKEKYISEIQFGNVVPIASNQELEGMDKAYELSEETSEHLEEGFYVGTKGTVSIIVEGTNGRVSMEDYEPALAELHKKGETVDHNVHVHGKPLPGKTCNTGEPKPSPEDYQNTFGESNSVHSILGYTKKIEYNANKTSNKNEVSYIRTIGFYVKEPEKRFLKAVDYDLFYSACKEINKKQNGKK